jgi:ABC-2 type transport system ATP-binding protein
MSAPSTPAIAVSNLSKTYASGFNALADVNLEIRQGEIFALLGPNGAGKTTLISIICGIVTASTGTVLVDGHDNVRAWRTARSLIGLVPQEITTDRFETVTATINLTRGLFNQPADPAALEKLLRDLSLWDKRNSRIITLSGGMKRRVMIAKALSHQPRILFLDEPTAGVDVELRRDMWALVRRLRDNGVTIVLTTHYIDEAEQMADRIGVITNGRLMMVEEKQTLMRKLGTSHLTIELVQQLPAIPEALAEWKLTLAANGSNLIYTYDVQSEETGIGPLLRQLDRMGVQIKNLNTSHSSLEQIFVNLVHARS